MATQLKSVRPTPDALDGMSLPGWLYCDAEFFEAEKKAFLRATPQVVCHESEIAEPGEWRTLEYLGESVIVIRGDDGDVRAFSNVCRHRGSRLLDGMGGCAKERLLLGFQEFRVVIEPAGQAHVVERIGRWPNGFELCCHAPLLAIDPALVEGWRPTRAPALSGENACETASTGALFVA